MRECREGNGNEGGYILDFLCITAMCVRTEAHDARIWDRTFSQWTEDMLRIVPRHVLKLPAKTRASSE